jgi:hypothetical protein
MLKSSIFYVLGGRLLYIITYIGFITSISKSNSPTNQKVSVDLNWEKFLVKEIVIIGFGILHPYLAVFVLAYSILISGYMLIITGKRNHQEFLRILGYFFSIITPILTLLTLFILQFGFSNKLTGELIAVILAWMGYGIKIFQIPSISNITALLNAEKSALWHRMGIPLKVTMIIIIMICPIAAYGAIYTQVFG